MKKLTIIFCCLWYGLLIQFTAGQRQYYRETAQAAEVFFAMGLEETQAKLTLTGELDRSFAKESAGNTLWEIADRMDPDGGWSMSAQKKENGSVWELQSKTEERTAFLRILAVQDGIRTVYYLDVSVQMTGSVQQIYKLRQCLEDVKKEQGLDSLVCLQLSGSFGRLLTDQEKSRKEETFLSACGACMVEESEEDNMRMVYAYRKGMGDSVLLGTNQVNLNMIFRDNQSETRCFVGIPAVLEDD